MPRALRKYTIFIVFMARVFKAFFNDGPAERPRRLLPTYRDKEGWGKRNRWLAGLIGGRRLKMGGGGQNYGL